MSVAAVSEFNKVINLIRSFLSAVGIKAVLLYCGWKSFKCTKDQHPDARGSEKKAWLVFWFVYSLIECLEIFTDVLLSWFPFYFEAKFLFIVYLGLLKGAQKLYKNVLRPFINEHEGEIDETLRRTIERVEDKARYLSPKRILATVNQALGGSNPASPDPGASTPGDTKLRIPGASPGSGFVSPKTAGDRDDSSQFESPPPAGEGAPPKPSGPPAGHIGLITPSAVRLE